MRIQFSFRMFFAVAVAVVLTGSQIALAQTQSATKDSHDAANANSSVQAQQNPVGPTHADGKAGKSSRPWFNEESEPDLHAVPR